MSPWWDASWFPTRSQADAAWVEMMQLHRERMKLRKGFRHGRIRPGQIADYNTEKARIIAKHGGVIPKAKEPA